MRSDWFLHSTTKKGGEEMAKRDTRMQLTRRTALRTGIAGAVTAALGSGPRGAWAAAPSVSASPLEPQAGAWSTWLLESGSELRPPAPPDGRASRSEIEELRALAAGRDAT